jgi:hypothetical protein
MGANAELCAWIHVHLEGGVGSAGERVLDLLFVPLVRVDAGADS